MQHGEHDGQIADTARAPIIVRSHWLSHLDSQQMPAEVPSVGYAYAEAACHGPGIKAASSSGFCSPRQGLSRGTHPCMARAAGLAQLHPQAEP